ncbi:MAG TPA: LytTR family DNA-binding domain-containing protein [Chryseosolibacter sp.]
MIQEKKYTAIVVDDELLSRDLIKSLLAEYDDVRIIGEASDGEEALVMIEENKPDIIFLDIQMPEMNGFQLLQHISFSHNPVIVFITAFDHYAAKAFDANAIDYLLKPFNCERFRRTMEKIHSNLERRIDGQELKVLKNILSIYEKLAPQSEQYLSKVMIKEQKKIFFIDVNEIQCIDASGDYIVVQTATKGHLLLESLNEMEKKLDPQVFVRIHRSTIVNVTCVKELHPYYNGEYFLVLKNNKRLKLSRSYRAVLKSHFDERL